MLHNSVDVKSYGVCLLPLNLKWPHLKSSEAPEREKCMSSEKRNHDKQPFYGPESLQHADISLEADKRST